MNEGLGELKCRRHFVLLNLSNRPDYIGVRDDRLFALLEDFGRFKGKLVYAYQASSCVGQYASQTEAQQGYFHEDSE